MTFRYELAAARGLLPSRSLPAHQSARPEPSGEQAETQIGTEEALDLVKQLTSPGSSSEIRKNIDALVSVCVQEEDFVERLFKLLFTLHISKNATVAFKTAMLLHELVSAGPATVTAAAIRQDGFLGWIETTWSRANVEKKTKAKGFTGGEIAVYISMLRKRIIFHAKYAKVLSTRWVPRADGSNHLGSERPHAMKDVGEILRMSAALTRTFLACEDETMELKRQAVPGLVLELSRAYLTMSWMFGTSDGELRKSLMQEFANSHNTAKSAIDAVEEDEDLVEEYTLHSILDLDEKAPTEIDPGTVVAALKKKAKKKKKKVTSVTNVQALSSHRDSGPEVVGGARKSKAQRKGNNEVMNGGKTEDQPQQSSHAEVKAARAARRRPSPPSKGRDPSPSSTQHANGYSNETVGGAKPSHKHPTGGPGSLAKRSLNVRRGANRTEAIQAPMTAPRLSSSNPYAPEGRRNLHTPSTNDGPRRQVGPSPLSYDHAGSNGMQNGARSRGRDANGRISTMKRFGGTTQDAMGTNPEEEQTERRLHSAQRDYNVEKPEESSSDDDSDSMENEDSDEKVERRPRRRNGGLRKTKKNGKKKTVSESDSDSDSNEKEDKKKTALPRRKKISTRRKKAPADEKKIPFDKNPPSKPQVQRPVHGDADYRGGSKEALAAAASGQKTPSMNAKF